jgi:hypothetical protein
MVSEPSGFLRRETERALPLERMVDWCWEEELEDSELDEELFEVLDWPLGTTGWGASSKRAAGGLGDWARAEREEPAKRARMRGFMSGWFVVLFWRGFGVGVVIRR